ncbi:GntR family transcriptional regulator [Wenjunlia tyrosinilytica]|uniref:GntR family transcriptional regulator n=1 Tax=Wenjunlia tyrosinilytica TaxID=1544741 RepID=A0A917ZZY9_9ACTN|nr:GntR family transcriptional regulator [Wenjunlia tyrosinilytica]GGP00495.1 GntR family transcriptional regulator [Wenjunlia tyrosinilytica]
MTDELTGFGGAAHRVAAELRRSILDGELLPGTRVRQEEVASRIGASRLPVREALRMLTAEGLLEAKPNKGARVSTLTAADVDLIYQMRERLEPLALIETLPHFTDADLAKLGDLQEQIAANDDVGDFLRLDREFHLLTYQYVRLESLSETVLRMWNLTQHYRRAFMRVVGSHQRWVINAEHDLLLEALHRRDPVDAERYLAGHIRRTRVELSRHPEIFEE